MLRLLLECYVNHPCGNFRHDSDLVSQKGLIRWHKTLLINIQIYWCFTFHKSILKQKKKYHLIFFGIILTVDDISLFWDELWAGNVQLWMVKRVEAITMNLSTLIVLSALIFNVSCRWIQNDNNDVDDFHRSYKRASCTCNNGSTGVWWLFGGCTPGSGWKNCNDTGLGECCVRG